MENETLFNRATQGYTANPDPGKKVAVKFHKNKIPLSVEHPTTSTAEMTSVFFCGTIDRFVGYDLHLVTVPPPTHYYGALVQLSRGIGEN